MKRAIRTSFVMINTTEFESLPRDITDSLFEQRSKGHGVKFVSNDTGKEITDPDELFGALVVPIERTLGVVMKGGE